MSTFNPGPADTTGVHPQAIRLVIEANSNDHSPEVVAAIKHIGTCQGCAKIFFQETSEHITDEELSWDADPLTRQRYVQIFNHIIDCRSCERKARTAENIHLPGRRNPAINYDRLDGSF